MKKSILKVGMFIAISILTTSCYDFNRRQNQLDAESKGKEILLEAESSKKAKIEEAKAELESSKLNAQKRIVLAEAEIVKAQAEAKATIIRANAEKESMQILCDAFGGKENYLSYLKYKVMYSGKGNKYFVATEASLPIMMGK